MTHQSKQSLCPSKHVPERLAKTFADNRINQWITRRIKKIKKEANSKHYMRVFLKYGVIEVKQDSHTKNGERKNRDGKNDDHWSHDLVESFAPPLDGARDHVGA